MNVVDDTHYGWVLLEENGLLYLDVLCSRSAVDYLFLLRLNEDEVERWRARGTAYLDDLAYQIHYSAPGVQGSRSPYKSRSLVLTPERERVSSAVAAHRSGN